MSQFAQAAVSAAATTRPGLQRRTAIVLIHGIGQQSPFETLNSYARTLAKELAEKTGAKYRLEHRLAGRTDAEGTAWVESFLRIKPVDANERGHIDVHEYYWAYLFQRSLTSRQVWRWVEEVWNRVGEQTVQRAAIVKEFGYEGQDFERRILRAVSSFRLAWLRYGYAAASALLPTFNTVPLLGAALKWVQEWVRSRLDAMLVDYVGDVAIYTTTSPLAAEYATRQKALNGAVAFTTAVLQDAENDRVVLAGHSLGSVIAYDTVNRLIASEHLGRIDLRKLDGLITFGSPLDRILLYFLRDVASTDEVRLRILEQIHSFRTRRFYEYVHAQLGEVHADWLERGKHVQWLNFYNANDPISSELRFYEPVTNHALPPTIADEGMNAAHARYWVSHEMFDRCLTDMGFLDEVPIVVMTEPGGGVGPSLPETPTPMPETR